MTSKAIVISRSDFGESNRYIQFLTQRWGMITALLKGARNSKKRYVGGQDLFCHNEIHLRGDPKGTPYVTELTVLNSFSGIRENLDRLMMAGKIIQWTKRLADTAVPMPEVYSLLGQTLAVIEKEALPERLELLGLVFKLKLLKTMGIKPELETCIRCTQTIEQRSYLDMEGGGLICVHCTPGGWIAEGLWLSEAERLFLVAANTRSLVRWPETEFPKEETLRLSRLLTQFASYHTHQRLV